MKTTNEVIIGIIRNLPDYSDFIVAWETFDVGRQIMLKLEQDMRSARVRIDVNIVTDEELKETAGILLARLKKQMEEDD